MPVVLDLQAWADELQGTRLPHILQDVTSLKGTRTEHIGRLTSLEQALVDLTSQHSIRISNAHNEAWLAQDRAEEASLDVYNTGLNARTYTDAQIQMLRDEFAGRLLTFGEGLTTTIGGNVTTSVQGTINAAVDQALDAVARAEAVATDLGFRVNETVSVTQQMLDIELPSQRAEIENAALRSITTKAGLDLLLQGFDHPTIPAGLDALREELENGVSAMTGSLIRLPAKNWCIDPASSSLTAKTPPPDAWFTADDIFAQGAELPAGAVSFGHAQHLPFDPEAVYKLTLQFRVLALPPAGQPIIQTGAVTWGHTGSGPAIVEQANLMSIPGDVAVGDVLSLNWYVTASATKALELEGLYQRLLTSSNGKRVFFYVQQPANGVRLRLGSLEIRDVTEAIEAADRANAIGGDAMNGVLETIEGINEAMNRNAELMARFGNWRFAAGWGSWATGTDLTADPVAMNDVLTGVLVDNPGQQDHGAARFTGPALLASAYSDSILPDQVFDVKLHATASTPCDVDVVITVYNLVDVKLREFILATGTINATAPWQVIAGEKEGEWGANAAKVRISLRMKTTGSVITVRELALNDITAQRAKSRAVSARSEAISAKEDAEGAESRAATSAVLAAQARNSALEHSQAAIMEAAYVVARANEAEQAAFAAEFHRIGAETKAAQAAISESKAAESVTNAQGSAASAQWSQEMAAAARDEAGTFQGLALQYSTAAVVAKNDAEGASVAATAASGLAVSMAKRGMGVLTDQFCPPHWATWTTAPVRTDNTQYPAGKQLTWNLTSGEQAGVSLSSNSALWSGSVRARSFRVEVDFKLLSGSVAGAGFIVDFVTGVGTQRIARPLTDMVVGAVLPNELHQASGDFPLPSGYHQNQIQQINVYMMMNYNSAGIGPLTAKHITVYRLQIFPTSFIEAGIQEQRTAIADLQGNAAAGYLIKAQAGGQVSLLELVAADGTAGSVSIAKIDAAQILLQGTVLMSQLVMTDINNKVRDDQIQEPNLWSGSTNSWVTHLPSYGTAAKIAQCKGAFRIAARPGGGITQIISRGEIAKPGQEFYCSCRVGASAGPIKVQLRVQFLDADGVILGSSGSGFKTTSAWETLSVVGKAPENTDTVRIFLQVEEGGYAPGGIIAFTAPSILLRGGAEAVIDGSMTASKIDVGSFSVEGLALFGGALQSLNFNAGAGTGWRIMNNGTMNMPNAIIKSAHIGNLEVDTIHVKDRAITDHIIDEVASKTLSRNVTGQIAHTLTFTLTQPATIIYGGYFEARKTKKESGSSTMTTWVTLDGVELSRTREVMVTTNTSPKDFMRTAQLAAGTHRIRIMYSSTDGSGGVPPNTFPAIDDFFVQNINMFVFRSYK